jgi:hypothetical protein
MKNKKAPLFFLYDQHNKQHRLSDYLGKWILLYFYPKDDTPGCTIEACSFRDNYLQLIKKCHKSPTNFSFFVIFPRLFSVYFVLLVYFQYV